MDLDSGADSVVSTPRSLALAHQKIINTNTMPDDKSVVRLMVSFGGKILPRPHDNQLRYVGGDTRIVAVNRSTTFSQLLSKLVQNSPTTVDFTVKYQLPNEELDALITVSTDEDVENMMEEFDRLSLPCSSNKIPRLRLFLFSNNINADDNININDDVSTTSSIASLLYGSRKRQNWFLDALNGGSSAAASLERGRSEASSIVSEVPDYLFGLDNNSDEPPPPPPKFKNRSGLSEPAPGSDPGSPAFGSTSSAPAMPNLPPVKTKPEKNEIPAGDGGVDPSFQHLTAPVWSHNVNPGSPYPTHALQPVPVYYVPTSSGGPRPGGFVAHRNVVPVTVPIPGPYVPQYGAVPVGFPGPGPMYDMQIQGNMVQGQGLINQQPIYYGMNSGGTVATYPGTGMPMGGDDDGSKGRTLQG